MKSFSLTTALTASTLALSLACAPATMAKPKHRTQDQQTNTVSGGTSGGVIGRDVTATTSGTGTSIIGPNGLRGTEISGSADATAENGEVTTRSDARSNDRRAMQKSSATAVTDEERARSRTRTMVTPNQIVRSRTTATYKADGQKPIRESVSTITCADGTVVDKMAGCKRR